MLNRVVLVGRLTRDVDLRYTPQGTAVANFTIACNRPFTNKETGESDADFLNIVVWRRPAENTAKYTKKGSLVGIDGRLQSRTYDDKDGKTIFVTEVVADSVQFLESRKSNNEQPQNNQTNTQADPFKNDGEPIDISDSDLPF